MRKLIFLLFIYIAVNLSVSAKQPTPDLILYNGKIFTSDYAQPNAEAIAIRGERILAVGGNAEIKKLADAKTRLIDLQGKTVIPGINDAHFHFTPAPKGFSLSFKTMEPSWRETIDALQNAVKQTAKGQWIFGAIGGDVIAETAADRFALDRIAPDNPILLQTYYGHGYIFNSKAMPLLHISEEEPDPQGGEFERVGNTKKVNGRIFEYADWRQARVLAEQVSDKDAIRDLKEMAGEAVRFGITSMQIMPTMRIDRFVRLLTEADLPIRVHAMPFSLTTPQNRDLSEIRQLSKIKSPNPKVTASGIKWVLDGTPFERGAALREPYNDRPDQRGKLNFPESEILRMVKESLELKQQILFHCTGDKTVEAVFDALEKAGDGKIDWRQKRVRIEHGDGVNGDLLERAKKLGVVIVQNPTHFSLVDMIYARYSPNTKFFEARSLIEAGIPFALGSDGPMNPFLNIMLAAIHPARPTEAITREQAVRAYTFGSAFAEFAETQKGTLTKGKLADLAVLSQDIFSAPVPDLPKTQSILTIVDGKIVHDAKILK